VYLLPHGLRYHDPVQDLAIHWLGVCLVLQRVLLVLRWVHQPGTRLEVDDILRQMLDQYTHCRVTLSCIILVV
jgi:hypothetical protein